MKRYNYLELKEPLLSKLENRYDFMPLAARITNTSASLNKHALKNTLRRQKLRQKMREAEAAMR